MTEQQLKQIAIKHYNLMMKKGCMSRNCMMETILAALNEANEISSNPMLADSLPSSCEHMYSRTMNQPYPRKCIHCGEVEKANLR